MKRAGVIGYPLGHSLSPAIVQAAFDAIGLEARYEAWPTPPEELESRLGSLRDGDVLGANVTIPHKETVMPLLDWVDGRAGRVGAVNTIANEGGRLAGHNTDVAGFDRALREDAGFEPKGKRVAMLGAGGAARAVAIALIDGGVSTIAVTGPIPEQLEKLIADLRGIAGSGVAPSATDWLDGAFLRALPEADLLVNCTPVGMQGSEMEGESPIAADHLPDGIVVFDLVYNPPETPLVLAARERGAKAVSGLGMLVYQAAESFRLWTGREAPVDRMLEAGLRALEGEAT